MTFVKFSTFFKSKYLSYDGTMKMLHFIYWFDSEEIRELRAATSHDRTVPRNIQHSDCTIHTPKQFTKSFVNERKTE
jgi:hypothetical protein